MISHYLDHWLIQKYSDEGAMVGDLERRAIGRSDPTCDASAITARVAKPSGLVDE